MTADRDAIDPGRRWAWDRAAELDAADPLAGFVDQFTLPDTDPPLVYFDGNSLGPQPRAAAAAVMAEVDRWRQRLIGGWNERWLVMGAETSDVIARIIGARAGTVRLADATTVCLSKLAGAAMAFAPQRPDVVTDRGNFPTDLYVLEAATRQAGGTVRLLDAAPTPAAVAAALDERVGLVALSHADFRTGALLDLPAITAVAHRAGALALWDLSHTAGVAPVDLDAAGVDLAVGCTYKYLHGGPGAPAYLYVRPDLVERLTSPIPGWFGHASPFAMEGGYRPAPGIDRFLAGTPPVLSLAAVGAGVALVDAAGVAAIRAKSLALTGLAIDLTDAWLADLGMTVVTPRAPAARGGHVALRHPQARQVTAMLLARNVVGDFRPPDIVRVGLSPLTLRYTDVCAGFARLADGLAAGDHEHHSVDLGQAT